MDDAISRQRVLKLLSAMPPEDATTKALLIQSVKQMDTAQPERQKGEWIDYTEDGYVECPFCHNATNCDGNKDELHFCFSCGADMREVIE